MAKLTLKDMYSAIVELGENGELGDFVELAQGQLTRMENQAVRDKAKADVKRKEKLNANGELFAELEALVEGAEDPVDYNEVLAKIPAFGTRQKIQAVVRQFLDFSNIEKVLVGTGKARRVALKVKAQG